MSRAPGSMAELAAAIPHGVATIADPPRISRPALAWEFLKIGALAFGETELAMIERAFVERRGILTREDLTEALTYTKALPGSTMVQIVAYLAYKLGGWPGSALATGVYLLPSTLAMMALAAGYVAISGLPLVRPAAGGLTAAAVGLLLATAWRLSRRAIDPRRPLSMAIAAAAVLVGGFLGVSAALIVVLAGLVGVAAYTTAEARPAAPRGAH